MTTTTNPNPRKAGTMNIGDTITVNIANTIGQASAIAANGSAIFTVKVTAPAFIHSFANDGTPNLVHGFGVVLNDGPVKGHEVLFKVDSVVAA